MNYVYLALSLLVGMVVFLFMLWVFYLAVMNLMLAREMKKLTPFAYAVGEVVLYIGLLLDVLANIFIMTFVYVELPKEWVVSMRVQRHFHGEGWRQKMSAWFADNLLNPFDPSGRHIT